MAQRVNLDCGEAMKITDYKRKHLGGTCYILGNGPSLADVDLDALEYPTFGSNRIYLSGYEPTYYSCVNPLVLEQYWDEIALVKSVKFLNRSYADRIGGIAIDTSLDVPLFADPEGPIWEGHTVTYVLLQLAYYMGFTKAILLGVDHDYGRHELRPNLELVATGPDAHHFHPDYFSKGARWNAPDLARSELAYSLAKYAWEGDGREIVNATERTKLTVFPLTNRRDRGGRLRVSAIVSAYNCPAEWVYDTVADLREQSEPCEIVVVHRSDDGWDFPGTVEVKTTDTPSVYAAWDLGIKAASGRYITNANTDDRRHPLSLQTLADVLDARPEIDVVYHDQYITWDEPKRFRDFLGDLNEPLVAGRYEGKPGVFVWSEHSLEALGQGCYLGPQPMWRASLHQRHGYFSESYKSAGDYEFWLRVATETNMMHIGAVLGVYCARMDGVELSAPAVGMDESMRALMIHQTPDGVVYTPQGSLIRAELGGKRAYLDAGQFFETVEKLRRMYADL